MHLKRMHMLDAATVPITSQFVWKTALLYTLRGHRYTRLQDEKTLEPIRAFTCASQGSVDRGVSLTYMRSRDKVGITRPLQWIGLADYMQRRA